MSPGEIWHEVVNGYYREGTLPVPNILREWDSPILGDRRWFTGTGGRPNPHIGTDIVRIPENFSGMFWNSLHPQEVYGV